MLITSAESRLAASSKEDWVRVDGSRNRLMTVRPRKVGTFLMGLAATSKKPSLSWKSFSMSARVRSSMERRCITIPFGLVRHGQGLLLAGSCPVPRPLLS